MRTRQARLQEEAAAARRRIEERRNLVYLMTSAQRLVEAEEEAAASWRGGPSVLAFLFAQPDAEAVGTLDDRGEYFDVRTGSTWDLFFPGYYKSEDPELENAAGAEPVGDRYLADWYFSVKDFDLFRQEVEDRSERWTYSGGADLVLVNAWLPEDGPIAVDWESTISGALTDADGTRSLGLAAVIERISNDLKRGLEDPAYGVGAVTGEPGGEGSAAEDAVRRLMLAALGGIATELGKKTLGG